jgi:hypothetical protein
MRPRSQRFALIRTIIPVSFANNLRDDIEHVANRAPSLIQDPKCAADNIIIVGTNGKSSALDELSRSGKIDLAQISGKWESFLIQVVPPPLHGISQALVIAGSDKRGTIYGISDLSEQIGVSPWYWWADAAKLFWGLPATSSPIGATLSWPRCVAQGWGIRARLTQEKATRCTMPPT